MHSIRLLLVFSLIFLSNGCSKDIDIAEINFGTYSGVGSGSIEFKPTTKIVNKQDVVFGWSISMRKPPEKIKIQEVVTGPDGVNWELPENDPSVAVTDAGKTVTVTKSIAKPGSPFFFHNWSISRQDPIGKYKAALFVDGKLVKEVRFTVSD